MKKKGKVKQYRVIAKDTIAPQLKIDDILTYGKDKHYHNKDNTVSLAKWYVESMPNIFKKKKQRKLVFKPVL